jgi:phage terminase large subunit
MSRTVNIETTITFEHLNESSSRVVQLIGGTRSGKSWGITQFLIVKALEDRKDISIVRKTIPSLKRTNVKDFKTIMLELGIWVEDSWNVTERVYTFANGSTFIFVNTDDADKLRGLKSDLLWCDEASEISDSAYFQLAIRTSGKIILSYNPTVSPFHWLRQMVECDRFVTTYRDNPFLPAEMVKAIEELEVKNAKLWKIYGLGEFAPNERAIYKFDIVETGQGELVGLGLDFGYNDKMALVSMWKDGGNLYIEELVYESQMTMGDLIKRLKDMGIQREEIWCDSSEPRSIEELYRAGFNAKAVKKGPDSIRFGISILQNWKLNVLKTSQNLINEIYGYQYAEDRGGYVTDTPEGGLDHLLDAMRYVAMMKLSIKSQAKGNYAITVR